MSDGLKIGELADRLGVSRDALRFYERVGLLPPPPRTAAGHRLYGEEDVHRLELIRRSQHLGLTLDDIRALLLLRDLPEQEACRQISARLRVRIEAIDQQLSTLQAFRSRLAEELALCEGAVPGSCPLVQRLMNAAELSDGRERK